MDELAINVCWNVLHVAPMVLDWDGFGRQNGCISMNFHVQLMQNMLFEIVFNCGENGVSVIEMGQEWEE